MQRRVRRNLITWLPFFLSFSHLQPTPLSLSLSYMYHVLYTQKDVAITHPIPSHPIEIKPCKPETSNQKDKDKPNRKTELSLLREKHIECFELFSRDIPSANLGFVDSRATTIDVTIHGNDFTIHQSPTLLSSTRAGGTTGAGKACFLLLFIFFF